MTAIFTDLPSSLRAIPYFAPLPQPALDSIVAASQRRTFEPGNVLMLQGAPPTGVWFVIEGSVKVTKISPEGDEFILRLIGPGGHFNEIPVLDDHPNAATVIALSLTTCCHIPAEVIRQTVFAHPAATQAAIHFLARQVRALLGQIEGLALQSVGARLALFLLKQAETPELNAPGITRAAIAAHLATTPETISRLLRKFETEGAIQFDRHQIVIVDEDRLLAVAGG